ncbi:hypothetical protein [Planobispora rosea]|uniref:hypothetical protein n=1 Tax=Planobispora rosea TaxID=35762 RepID=UPI00083B5EFE|nr:hypothetical protein [Planobispora rosea]
MKAFRIATLALYAGFCLFCLFIAGTAAYDLAFRPFDLLDAIFLPLNGVLAVVYARWFRKEIRKGRARRRIAALEAARLREERASATVRALGLEEGSARLLDDLRHVDLDGPPPGWSS